jgi:hypothetical protein
LNVVAPLRPEAAAVRRPSPAAAARHALALLALLSCMAALAAAPANAADAKPKPSAKELWETYPLHPETNPIRAGTPTVAPIAPTAERRESAGGAPVVPAIIVAALVLAASLIGVRRRASRRHEDPAPTAVADTLVAHRRAYLNERLLGRAPIGEPPDPERTWIAEIRWTTADGAARFAAVARDSEGTSTPDVAVSPSLRWPPADDGEVKALSDAVDELERSLVAAGWSVLPPGAEWYSKRFAWEPIAAEPDAAPTGTGRFRRSPAWPEGSDQLWRCELRWKPHVLNSRFEAVAEAPEGRAERGVGSSASFKRFKPTEPDPASLQYRAELMRLIGELKAAGWEHVGRGARWYSERFVWTKDGVPPDCERAAAGEVSRN